MPYGDNSVLSNLCSGLGSHAIGHEFSVNELTIYDIGGFKEIHT